MTTKLPPALQPWSVWLDWFDPEIATIVGELLLRLDPLLSRGNSRLQRGKIEPDGVDDLRQRGPYERLLLSEWALADALPDEFLRRAAYHEHLFLAPRLVTPQSDGLIAVVFDAGPSQWGAARLVHVAMWILLARRAQATHMRFAWGLAHRPGVLTENDSSAMLKNMLSARTHEVSGADRHRAWRDYFDSADLPPGERWLLAATDENVDAFSHVGSVRRGFDHRLHVRLGSAQNRRSVDLPMPPAQQAAQLLRGDFLGNANAAAHRRTAGKLSLRQPPLLSIGGDYVALPLLGESRAMVIKIQRSEKEKPAKPRYGNWSSGAQLLCGALSGGSFGGIVADAHHLYFWKIWGFQTVQRPSSREFTVTPGLARWLSCVWLNNGGKTHRIAVLDNAGRLLTWTNASASHGRSDAAHVILDEAVVALVQADPQRLMYAAHKAGKLKIKLVHRDGNKTLVTSLPISGKPAAVFFCGAMRDKEWNGAVCVEQRPEGKRSKSSIYRLFEGRPQDGFREYELTIAPGSKALGLIKDGQTHTKHILLALSADRRGLIGVGPDGIEDIYRSSRDIVAVSLGIDGDLVALINLDGQLILLGDGGRRLLMSVSGQAEAADE
ncbi:hypothetical protein [Lysobacter sp. Root604]|uniref:hypothetical protein n=1 Tax=Lysobacter sp. Root604 TaxID=1736568 RepID=UPI0006F243D2|nr:hypothetical protein [Lysobacter sp. Root604]KRA21135.1 hypothetical protein ASD69_07605 [Lysobacter sp. Root604]